MASFGAGLGWPGGAEVRPGATTARHRGPRGTWNVHSNQVAEDAVAAPGFGRLTSRLLNRVGRPPAPARPPLPLPPLRRIPEKKTLDKGSSGDPFLPQDEAEE